MGFVVAKKLKTPSGEFEVGDVVKDAAALPSLPALLRQRAVEPAALAGFFAQQCMLVFGVRRRWVGRCMGREIQLFPPNRIDPGRIDYLYRKTPCFSL